MATVAGGFPSGVASIEERIEEIRQAVDLGAQEIDTVLDRGAFMAGRRQQVLEEITASKDAAGPALLKVILETGEFESDDRIREASHLAMEAGADFLKTSTGKVRVGATPAAARLVMESVRDFEAAQGRRVGVKVSGGIKTAAQAREYAVLLDMTLGEEWMTPELFRIGASVLLDHLLTAIQNER